MSSTVAERITELEIRYTHQQAFIDELSELIRQQAGQIESLKLDLKTLRESADAPEIGGASEKPPHY